MNLKSALLALAVSLLGAPAQAQQPEQATLMFAPPMIWCLNNAPGQRDAALIYLENYFDGILPDNTYILSASVWIDGVRVSDVLKGKYGNYPIAIDPQQQYAKETGWPYGPPGAIFKQPAFYKMIVARRLENPENEVRKQASIPVRYSRGNPATRDGIAVSTECVGGDGTPLWVFAILDIIAPTVNGVAIDLKDLPVPADFYKVPLGTVISAGTASSVRNVYPGPAQATTKFRAKVSQQGGNVPVPYAQVQHMSVCLQSGSSSNCQSAPVQLKFGSEDNYNLNPGDSVWSNEIDLAVPAGQNVLVTASSMNGGTGNSWSMNTTAGYGMFYSTVDAWNTIGMSNPTFYPTMTRSVTAVQMR